MIGRVEVALRKVGIVICEGTLWLAWVNEEEFEKRKVSGQLRFTVVVRVREMEIMGQLCCSGPWVRGYWYSVKRFIAVQRKRRVEGWEKVMKKYRDRVAEMEERIEKTRFGSEKGMVASMYRVVEVLREIVNVKMEVTLQELGVMRRKIQEMDMKGVEGKGKKRRVTEEMKMEADEKAVFERKAKAFFYELKVWDGGKKGGGVDFSKPSRGGGFHF